MSLYYENEPWNDEEFSPPTIQLVVREKIINIKQSRDETLDEYLWYFDSIVTSCPHHGFTNLYLLQRFLGGMMPQEWEMLNEAAAGGSVMNLTMTDLWYLINDLAARSRPRQDQAEPLEGITTELASSNQQQANMIDQNQAEAEKSWAVVKATIKNLGDQVNEMLNAKPRISEEEPRLDCTGPTKGNDPLAPEEEPTEPLEPDLIAKPVETYPILTAEPTEVPDLTAEAAEEIMKGPDLVVEVPQLNPPCFMQIIATEDHGINDNEVQGELEAEHEPKQPTRELSLVTSQEKPHEDSLVPRQPSITATMKRIGRGACLMSPTLNGTKPNFQTRKGANHSNMKKRQRHGPKEWKPGRRNKRARLVGPAAMVKEPSSSRSKRAAEKKFDLTRPWDPTL